MRHDGLERGFRQLELEIDRAPVSLVHDCAVAVRANEKARDGLDGPLRGGQTHAHERRLGDLLQALERQREVRAAARADDRMDLVHDHGPHRPQHLPAALGREQQIQRLGRRHEDVRRRPENAGALGRRRIARAYGGCDARSRHASLIRKLRDAAPGQREILVDVRAQRFERRDVDDPDLVRQRRREAFFEQVVEAGEKRGERLP